MSLALLMNMCVFSQGFKGFMKSFFKKEQHKREFSMKIRQKTEGEESKQKRLCGETFNKVKQQLPPTSLAAPHQQSMFNIPYGQAVELNLIHDYVKQYYIAGEMKKNTMTGAHAFLFFIHGLHFELCT